MHTVTGTITPDGLAGYCAAHVHLLGGPAETPPDSGPHAADLHLRSEDIASAEAGLYHAAGGRALVEMSCLDFNRSLAGLRRVSLRTGVLIVATTGFRRGATALAAGYPADWGAIANRLRRDVYEGEDGVRCGLLKAGSGRGELTGADRAILRAAAVVQQETGYPVSTHTERGELAVDQLRELSRWGADLSRVAVGHLDREPDPAVHQKVLASGAFVLYDQIGKEKYGGVGYYASLLRQVQDSGCAGRLLLSSDFGRQSYFAAAGGGPGLAYLLTDFREAVAAGGVDPATLEQALTDNPREFLACSCGRTETAEE